MFKSSFEMYNIESTVLTSLFTDKIVFSVQDAVSFFFSKKNLLKIKECFIVTVIKKWSSTNYLL